MENKRLTHDRIDTLMLNLKDDFSDVVLDPLVSDKQRKFLRLRIYGRMMKLSRMAKQLLQEGGEG